MRMITMMEMKMESVLGLDAVTEVKNERRYGYFFNFCTFSLLALLSEKTLGIPLVEGEPLLHIAHIFFLGPSRIFENFDYVSTCICK